MAKTLLRKYDLLLLIKNQVVMLGAERNLLHPCDVYDLEAVEDPDANANWTWDRAYQDCSVDCAALAAEVVAEFQKTHDVIW